ncbi:hypothetical protein PHYPO_G00057740 [Pangasianodon hypophthalmus]|uniref:Ig-like domain-containing protein n=1 Tax=Pangasianodon hypophthalmus TaxID=310915 RepID=A0A5N5M0A5_PANHP|nr:hypothetical protein PHYPO_G00057740 [Pangasianodon hypophthalmus]
MTWTLTISGSLCVCITAVMLLHSSPTTAHPKTEVTAPTIVNIAHKRLGTSYRITCKVNPGGLKDETMVYWLADGHFLEEVYKNINVTKTEKKSNDGTEYLHTKVVFTDLSQKDFHTNFTCIAMNPAGFAKENVRIKKVTRR